MKQIIMNLNSADNFLYYTNEIRQGENLANELVVKLSAEWTGYRYLIRFKLNDNLIVVTPELFVANGEVKYNIDSTLTNEAGSLKIIFEAFEIIESTTRIIKSAVTNLRVTESLEGGTTIVPEDYVPWYTLAIDAASRAAASAIEADLVASEAVADIQAQFDAVVSGVNESITNKIKTSTFTATVNSTSHIPHNLIYDSIHDDLLVVYNGVLCDVGANYTENANKTSIDLASWSINIGEKILFKLYKNVK